MRFITTSAVANAAPMRTFTAVEVPRMPTPMPTAKTSRPSETATTKTFTRCMRLQARVDGGVVLHRIDFGLREQTIYRRSQLRNRKRLVQKQVCARVFRTAVHCVIGVSRNHQDRNGPRPFVGAKPFDQIDTGNAGKHEIADDDVERAFAIERDERAFRVVAYDDLVRPLSQHRFNQCADRRIVVGNEYPPRALRHTGSGIRLEGRSASPRRSPLVKFSA